MERTLYAVEPDDSGWQIRLAGESLMRRLDKVAALEKADRMASERHAVTGQPTGVFISTPSGEAMVVGMHG